MKVLALVTANIPEQTMWIMWIDTPREDCSITRIHSYLAMGELVPTLSGDMPGPMEGEIAYLTKQGWTRVI